MSETRAAEPAATPALAAADLGSNSFHMVIARFPGDDIQVLDKLRVPVRLAEGLRGDRSLSPESQERAVACLEQFEQRLRHVESRHIRAVGTNTFRRARGGEAFRARAEAALGASIEILAGHEEARLVYLGVVHTAPFSNERRLVIDIGGGSTELITGEGLESRMGHSRQLGCVSASRRFFPTGELTLDAFRAAETAAAVELRPVREALVEEGWSSCLGSSGTVNTIGKILSAWNLGGPDITLASLEALRDRLVERGRVEGLELETVRGDRWSVLPGGLAVLIACFRSLRLESMRPASGALREGVLYDLVGRMQHRDARQRSIQRWMEQYRVDRAQSARVETAAHYLLERVREAWALPEGRSEHFLSWAASLHEIGLAVAYSDYHRHGGYLVANGELQGFSRDGQALLAALISNHRRRLRTELFEALPEGWGMLGLRLSLLLRLAVLLYRSRQPEPLPPLRLHAAERRLRLGFPAGWLDDHPLTRADLQVESDYLAALDIALEIETF